MLNNNYYQRTADKISCDLIIIKLNKYKMNKEKLIDSIIELACELDRGDIKLDELVNKAYALVKKDRAEQLILSGVGSSLPDLAECNQASLDYATKKNNPDFFLIKQTFKDGVNWALNYVTRPK